MVLVCLSFGTRYFTPKLREAAPANVVIPAKAGIQLFQLIRSP